MFSDNKFNRNDPLVNAVQGVMKENERIRTVTEQVNKQFGIQSRKQLPNERLDEYDSQLKKVLAEETETEELKEASLSSQELAKRQRIARAIQVYTRSKKK